MHEIFKFMSNDHERLDGIFLNFRNSSLGSEYSRIALEEFMNGIDRHIRWEEEILFPAVRLRLGGDSLMIDELLMQHKIIHESIRGLYDSATAKMHNSAKEADIEQLLHAHDKMEEDGIYPWIDEFIDDKTKHEMLSKMQR